MREKTNVEALRYRLAFGRAYAEGCRAADIAILREAA
jgi:hypothetical protein